MSKEPEKMCGNTEGASQEFMRKESNLRKMLLENLPCIAMILKNGTREIVFANSLAIKAGAVAGNTCHEMCFKSKEPCPFCLAPETWGAVTTRQAETEYYGKWYHVIWTSLGNELYVHYVFDITERKLADEALRESERLLRESEVVADLGSYVLDTLSGYWKGSVMLDKLFGIDKAYDRSVEGWKALIHPDDRQHMTDYFTNEVLGKNIRFDKEYRIIRDKDKAVRWVHGLGSLRFDAQGHPIKMHGTIQDVTDRKLAEGELKLYRENLENVIKERTLELEESNRQLDAFNYSVSHDLRAPLRAIDGFSRVLVEDYNDKLDDNGRRIINVIRDNVKRMSHLIDDLLQFARMGRKKVQMVQVDMEKIVKSVLENMKADIASDRTLKIEIKKIPSATGDPDLMYSVWYNILSNAVKFTRIKKEGVIEIGYASGPGEDAYYVKDNGAGFDMAYVHKLFELFQRLHSDKDFEGTGIGLTIAKQIIGRHGGKIWAEGKKGEGATFYFSLPKKAVRQAVR